MTNCPWYARFVARTSDNIEIFVRPEKAPHGLGRESAAAHSGTPAESCWVGWSFVATSHEVKEEEFFRAGQSRVLEMIAADAPLLKVLTELVLLMEGSGGRTAFVPSFF